MGSIEGAYYSISRHMIDSWRDLSWWPAWYGGIPFYYSYPPLLHALVALFSVVFHVGVSRAHHFVTGFFYAFGPVAAFWLSLRLSRSVRLGFFVALAYSIISPSSFLVPSVLHDLGNPLLPRRLHTLSVYGDGPHIASLALIPLALLALDFALSKDRPFNYVLAALSFAAVTLTNWLGAMALALLLISYLTAMTNIESPSESIRLWLKTAATGALAYLYAAPLVTPSLIRTIQFNAQTIGGDFRSSPHVLLEALPYIIIGIVLVKVLCEKTGVGRYQQTFLYFVLFTGGICMSMEWFKRPMVPQPERYHLELDLGLILLVIPPLVLRLDLLNRKWKVAWATVALLAIGSQVTLARRFAREVIQPLDIKKTIEFQTAKWFDRNARGGRVMALGSVEFFLNEFGETPQLGGGFEQGNPNWENRVAQYIVSSVDGANDEPAVTLCWLKAFGIRAISVDGPQSKDAYHPFRHIARFGEIGTLAWSKDDDYIYKIPMRNDSLTHAVLRTDLVKKPPVNGIDTAEMMRYVRAIDDAALPDVTFRWTSQHSAEMRGKLRRTQVLATQINYFSGWKAFVGSTPVKTFEDGLGFLVVDPKCDGNCTVHIVYDGGPEQAVAVWVSICGMLASFLWVGNSGIARRKFVTLPAGHNPIDKCDFSK